MKFFFKILFEYMAINNEGCKNLSRIYDKFGTKNLFVNQKNEYLCNLKFGTFLC
jgi:hypothetical protein